MGFLANGFISMSMFMASETDTVGMTFFGMVLGGYIVSIIDANLAAKEVPQQKLKSGPSRIHSAPPQILVGSYNIRF